MMPKRCLSLLILLVGVTSHSSFAQNLVWESITSVGAIGDIAIGEGQVWGGSNGGVLQLDTETGETAKFTNTQGLTFNEVVAVARDRHGSIWFALQGGVLDRYFPEEQRWEQIRDYEDQVITDLVTFGDSLYVGLDFGVSLYTIDKREIKETYVNLGLSSGQNLERIGANSVFIAGLQIWVTTDKGLAQSSLELSNLQAPDNWNQHTVLDGLPTNVVNDLVILDGTPYAATAVGVARLVDGVWETVGDVVLNAVSIRRVQPNSFFGQETVVALSSNNVYWYDFANDSWNILGESFSDVTAIATDGPEIWIGRRNQGLAHFRPETEEWELFTHNSPSSNNFRSLTLDAQGRLWCANPIESSVPGVTGGINMFDGEVWRSFTQANGLKNNDQRTVVTDAQGRIWAGSWGGGISIFEENDEGFDITQIDTSDGVLAGFIADPGFVLINGLARDQSGNIWVLNRQAATSNVLLAHTPDGDWFKFSTNEGLLTPFVLSLEIDTSGRVWVGTEDRGVRVLDYNNTLSDKSDDDFTQGLTSGNDGLFDDEINALAMDREGTMWIGTPEGLNFWFQGQVGNRFGLINDFVNTIGIDARNNKWFGTANGVSVLSSDGVTWTHYTTGNSPLVGNNVLSFAFNAETGEVWIGTSNGLSRVETPFVAPKPDFSELSGYPNPFMPGRHEDFIITNLAENTSVKIYTVSGRLVREFDAFDDINGGFVIWDGKDESGNFVASGIYVYFAYTDGGLSASGKVAVIRP